MICHDACSTVVGTTSLILRGTPDDMAGANVILVSAANWDGILFGRPLPSPLSALQTSGQASLSASIHLPPAFPGTLHNNKMAVTTKMLSHLSTRPKAIAIHWFSVFIGVFMQPADEIHRPLLGLHINPSHILAEHADAD